ncbi:glycosyltransferase family 4 protein [bacterium]|nr:glycosyltransferase family 4 protein [bacterium]
MWGIAVGRTGGLGLRILMVARHAVDPMVMSGTQHFMLGALRRAGVEVDVLDRIHPGRSPRLLLAGGVPLWSMLARLAVAVAAARLRGCRFDTDRSLALSRYCAYRIAARLAKGSYDAVFGDKATVELASLRTSVPILYSHDAVAADLVDYCDRLTRLSRRSLQEASELERRAVDNARVCLYRSNWAAESARRQLALPAAKVRVLHIGPGFEDDPLAGAAAGETGERQPCRLLVVGVNWWRKGCDVTVAATRALRRMGLDARLTVCGCEPPPGEITDAEVAIVPRLDKHKPADVRRLVSLYRESTFVLLPTRADTFGIVLLEAMACGRPVVATRMAGMEDVVDEGVSGFLLPPGASGEEYAGRIHSAVTDPAQYGALCRGARARYEREFNWRTWASGVREILGEVTA